MTKVSMIALLAATAGMASANDISRSGVVGAPQVGSGSLADGSFAENFDNVPGLFAGGGWNMINNSTPAGTNPTWFQGNTGVFGPHASTGYAAANFQAVGGANTINMWMVAPTMTLTNGDTIRFWSRTVDFPGFPDRLQLRMSTNGASANVGTTNTSVGDFTNLLVDINPSLTLTGYPSVWTEFTATVSGIGGSGSTSGRLAFRYFVTDGGPSGANSDYIGVDTFSVDFIPAPGAAALMGIAGLAGLRRRR